MKKLRILVFIFLFQLVTALCSTISIAFRHHVYPCNNQKSHPQTMKLCSDSNDCIENAYCWNHKTCICKDGYLVNKNETHLQCLKISTKLGDPCIENVQCSVTFTTQSECRNNVCVCSNGAHYEAQQKRCYQSAGIGEPCQTSYNCYIEGSDSHCIDRICKCPFQFHPSKDNTRCIQSAALGKECFDEECITKDSICQLGICNCKPDYVLSNDKSKCLKSAKFLGDPCEEDSQCKIFIKNSKCGEDNKCSCILDLNQLGSVCQRKINPNMIGKACTTRSQCVQPILESELLETEAPNVNCLNNICSCAKDYTLTEDKKNCIRFSENGNERINYNCYFLIFSIISTLFYII